CGGGPEGGPPGFHETPPPRLNPPPAHKGERPILKKTKWKKIFQRFKKIGGVKAPEKFSATTALGNLSISPATSIAVESARRPIFSNTSKNGGARIEHDHGRA